MCQNVAPPGASWDMQVDMQEAAVTDEGGGEEWEDNKGRHVIGPSVAPLLGTGS